MDRIADLEFAKMISKAIRKQQASVFGRAEIDSVQTDTVTISFRGDTFDDVEYPEGYTPTAGDIVLVGLAGEDYIVLMQIHTP